MIKKLFLRNFNSHKETAIEFQPGVNVVIGHGGAGKTSLLEAIGFAGYGHLAAPKQQYLRHGSRFGLVSMLAGSVHGGEVKITRHLENSTYSLLYDDKLLNRGSSQVQDAIKDHLGIPFHENLPKLFTSSVLMEQGMITAPFLMPESARRTHFNDVIGVSDYLKAYQDLGASRRTLLAAISEASKTLIQLQAVYADDDKKKALERKLSEASEILSGISSQIEALAKAEVVAPDIPLKLCPTCNQPINEEMAKDVAREESIKKRYQEIDVLNAKGDAVSREVNRLKGELEELRSGLEEITEAEKAVAVVRERLDHFSKIRDTIKAAGPMVAESRVARVSEVASRIFGDMMPYHDQASLKWAGDYGLSATLDGRELSFTPNLSGSQQALAAIAIRVALAVTMGSRLLIMDEPTAHMDREQKQLLVESISSIAATMSQIIIVTHDTSFSSMTDNVIHVSLNNGVSVTS